MNRSCAVLGCDGGGTGSDAPTGVRAAALWGGLNLSGPVINTVAFGRRCIPPQAALGIVRLGSNTAGMLPPPTYSGACAVSVDWALGA